MDFRQIEAFIKVVELGGFSKAADELHISQPSVSTYITSLENELHTILINRSTKSLSMTLAGERFLEKARALIALKQESIESLQSLSEDISGDIRILASSVPAQYLLPRMIAVFHKQHPNLTFILRQADTAEVVRGIAAAKADIGFAGSMPRDKKCEFFEIARETLVFVAPFYSGYTRNKIYSLEELLYANSFIAREPGSGTRMEYEKFFVENGIRLDEIKTCASMDQTGSIINAVMSGLGVSIVSELAVRRLIEQKQLIRLRLQKEMPERKIYAVLNKSIAHSHLVKLFVEYLENSRSAAAG